MNLFILSKGRRIAFGHFKSAEIQQMETEGWKVESAAYLKSPPRQQQKRTSKFKKQVCMNKHGIPVEQ